MSPRQSWPFVCGGGPNLLDRVCSLHQPLACSPLQLQEGRPLSLLPNHPPHYFGTKSRTSEIARKRGSAQSFTELGQSGSPTTSFSTNKWAGVGSEPSPMGNNGGWPFEPVDQTLPLFTPARRAPLPGVAMDCGPCATHRCCLNSRGHCTTGRLAGPVHSGHRLAHRWWVPKAISVDHPLLIADCCSSSDGQCARPVI